ncbi:MAG: glycine--tRNA ligase subunit beta, partial [Deltaproteobacteria bacterium]
MDKELLLEIGVEDLPAGFLPKAISDMERLLANLLDEQRVAHGDIVAMATPRRLCVSCASIADKQEDQLVEKMGPAKKAGFDEHGNPSKALIGFAKGQGLDISALETITTEKGEYFITRKLNAGVNTMSLLPTILPQLIMSLPFKKSMRWSDMSIRFARPIHWLLALYGGEIVPFSIENISSSNKTLGHRFMSPSIIDVKNSSDYSTKLKQSFVIVNHIERREIISKITHEAAKSVGGCILPNDNLLEEVTFLTEYPTAICGSFDKEYLRLPKDVLITTMMAHQKYFPVIDDRGALMPYFVTINNTLTKDTQVVKKGNEKVIRARLKDAEFFFYEDQKVSLDARIEGLKKVVYHSDLGTSYEKMERFRTLASYIADKVAPTIKETVDRSAFLAKADLDTQMVGEFSELQGIMGREYAL